MKNQRMFKSVMIMTAMVIVFALAAGLAISCGDSAENSDAVLISITIRENTLENIPTAISLSQWKDGEFYDPEYTETVYLNDAEELKGARVKVVISDGAQAAYGLADGFDQPSGFSSSSTLPDITIGQALYVRVTSEDGSTINYYRFNILTKSSNSQLSTLKGAGMTADLGNPAATWNGVTTIGLLSLSKSLKDNVLLMGTPTNNKATVEYALVTTAGGTPEFSAADTYDFEDGNTLYVKVTAENKISVSYYKIEVQVGRDATLATVIIGEAEADNLGTPRATWGLFTAAQRGTCQADDRMPAEGFTVEITANDQEATVEWISVATTFNNNSTSQSNPEPTTYTGVSPFKFPSDASDLIIKVTAANGTSINYYRIRLITKNFGTIYKGTPQLDDPANAANKQYIDPIWNDTDYFEVTDTGEAAWLDVSRLNTAESYSAWFGAEYGRHTTARAKVLWDDDGLWSYWDIDFADYKTTETGNIRTRSASLSGDANTYRPGQEVGTDFTDNSGTKVPSDAHTRDSVEFFVNERFQTYKAGNYGNQYRSGLPASDGTIWLSGERGNAPDNFNPITRFQLDKKVRTWVKTVNGKQTGYVIIMGVPWVHYDADDDKVFGTDGKVIDGAEIGLELQVNACSVAQTRDGILTWNGVTSQAYQNVKSFGIATLKENK